MARPCPAGPLMYPSLLRKPEEVCELGFVIFNNFLVVLELVCSVRQAQDVMCYSSGMYHKILEFMDFFFFNR